MAKLIAQFGFSFVSKSGNKTNAYILDGSPEQHAQFIDHMIGLNPDLEADAITFDDRDGKFPELSGNPIFFDIGKFRGDIVEIFIPADDEKRPYIKSDELERELAEADLLGEGRDEKRAILAAYQKTLRKHRYSVKQNAKSEVETDETL